MQPSSLAGISAALAALPLLFACTTDPAAVSGDLKGTINVVVLDAATAAPVSGVRVQLVGEGSERTSAGGQVSFAGVRAGNYFVRMSKTGYESSQEPVTLGVAGTQEVAALTASQTWRIHRQGATVRGRVLLRPLNLPATTALVNAAGVTVELRSTASGTGSANTVYLEPVRTTVTASNGTFSFDSLPEISGYSLTIPEFLNGGKPFSLGATAVASGTLLAGQSYTHPNITLAPSASGSLQVFARSLQLAANQPLVLEFSSRIDTARLAASSIQLRSTVGTFTSNIGSTRLWSQNFTVLSIGPIAGTWNTGTVYSVQLTGVRDSQNRLLATTTITTLPAP